MSNSELLAQHISQEIDKLSESALTFRTRTAFTVWIGPFILLGALLASKSFDSLPETIPWCPVLGLWGGYVALGFVAGGIERHYWTRANKLRRLLAKTIGDDNETDIATELQDDLVVRNLLPGYALVFALLFGVFTLTAYVLSLLVTP